MFIRDSLYEVEYPDFHVTVLDKPQEDMEKDLLMTSLPAQTFIMRYLLEGQYIASSGKFMTFREVPTYGELYIQPFTGRCCLLYTSINLAKQLNVLLSQLGVAPSNIVMNVGTAAVGYGFEYVVSTMDRVKAAALGQADAQLQMPIITPVADEA